MILVSLGVSGGLVGAVGLPQLLGLPSQRLGEWAWGYCWAGHCCRSTGATARAGGGCEGKIEKSITKAAQKKKRKKEREGETKEDEELQKAESYRALLINSIRGRPFFFLLKLQRCILTGKMRRLRAHIVSQVHLTARPTHSGHVT